MSEKELSPIEQARQDCIERKGVCGGCPHAVPSLGNTCKIRELPQVAKVLGLETPVKPAKPPRNPGGRPSHKLTRADVRMILDSIEAGETQISLAKRYGVSRGTIGKIAVGMIWREAYDAWHAQNGKQAG